MYTLVPLVVVTALLYLPSTPLNMSFDNPAMQVMPQPQI
jgi:hypothetical protein